MIAQAKSNLCPRNKQAVPLPKTYTRFQQDKTQATILQRLVLVSTTGVDSKTTLQVLKVKKKACLLSDWSNDSSRLLVCLSPIFHQNCPKVKVQLTSHRKQL